MDGGGTRRTAPWRWEKRGEPPQKNKRPKKALSQQGFTGDVPVPPPPRFLVATT